MKKAQTGADQNRQGEGEGGGNDDVVSAVLNQDRSEDDDSNVGDDKNA
jgi:hypothetical protein